MGIHSQTFILEFLDLPGPKETIESKAVAHFLNHPVLSMVPALKKYHLIWSS